MKLRPLQDRVPDRRVDAEAKTPAAYSSPTRRRKSRWKAILAVIPDRDEGGWLHPLDIKNGDRVLFAKWSGTEVKLDGEDLMIMKESDIMGVLDRPATQKKAA